ncbi:hypothetical protein Hanom_Chr09g00859651 [Helianthus anomalus]
MIFVLLYLDGIVLLIIFKCNYYILYIIKLEIIKEIKQIVEIMFEMRVNFHFAPCGLVVLTVLPQYFKNSHFTP